MSVKTKYEPREQVKERIIQITLDLLLTSSPKAITLRQIAAQAKCHHPDIPNYFGGKLGLLEAVYPLAVRAMTESNFPLTFSTPTPVLIRLVRLVSWLSEHDSDVFTRIKERPLLDALTNTYVDRFHLSNSDARLMAQRLMALMMSSVLSPEPLGFGPDQFAQHFDLELRIVQKLASE